MPRTAASESAGRRGRKRNRSRKAKSRGRWARWVRRIVAAALVLVMLPVALTPLYIIPAVHPVSMLMIGDALSLRGYRRDWISLDEMGDALPHSVLMSEDGQFCAHGGVDWSALSLVLEDALAGEGLRGASTIPMQTVKNLFLWHGRSYLRKSLEVPLSLYFDAVVPKKRILEIYLNIAEWGPNIYGAEAAAQEYFGQSAKTLTGRQAALLAVSLPNPAARNPAAPTPGMNRLAAVVEQRAQQAGDYVTCLR